VAWHWITPTPDQVAVAAPHVASPAAASPDPAAQGSPVVPKTPKAAERQLPGLNLDTAFWRLRLEELNREQAAFELLEWRIVHSAMDTIHRYVESVVVPAVERAEPGGG
jgi:hypothetical protein